MCRGLFCQALANLGFFDDAQELFILFIGAGCKFGQVLEVLLVRFGLTQKFDHFLIVGGDETDAVRGCSLSDHTAIVNEWQQFQD